LLKNTTYNLSHTGASIVSHGLV